MHITSSAETGDEGRAVAVLPSCNDQAVSDQALGDIQAAIATLSHANGGGPAAVGGRVRNGAFASGRTAKAVPRGDTLVAGAQVAGAQGRTHAGGMGLLSLTALTFATMSDARAADANVTVLDEDSISFKHMPHGSLELVTKEANPRYLVVEDPGETVVISKSGTTINVAQLTNSVARMEELQAAQRELYDNWTKGLGPGGSGTTPFSNTLSVQPINFIQPESPAILNTLPALPAVEIKAEFIFIRPKAPEPTLTLALGSGLNEVDTVVFDTFNATIGTFGANSSSGGTLTWGLSGGTQGTTVLNGLTYNISQVGTYGTLYVNSASGAYTFVPNDATINALKAPTTQSFVVTVSDGKISASEPFDIAIAGTNDAAIIAGNASGSVGDGPGIAGAASFAAVASSATADDHSHSLPPRVATGTLTSTDVDDPANTFAAVTSPTASKGGYGTFTMTANGVWTYTLDEGNHAVQALNVGDKLTDTFIVTTVDGTPQEVTIVIGGRNDPADISGDTCGHVVEAVCKDPGIPIATGTLTATDVDNPDGFTPVKCGQSDGGYGTFTMSADGCWTYKLDNSNCKVQSLGDCDTLTDTFTVTSVDGTEQVITIIIGGKNDPADIFGCTSGHVVEAGCKDPGKPIAAGTLAATDVDNRDGFTPVKCGQSDGGYGTFTMSADGCWTYKLDNDNCDVQALGDCDTLTDTFTVTSVDGTEQVITITIQGADDDRWYPHYHDHDKWAQASTSEVEAASTSGSVGGQGSAGTAAASASTASQSSVVLQAVTAPVPAAGDSFHFKDQGAKPPESTTVASSDSVIETLISTVQHAGGAPDVEASQLHQASDCCPTVPDEKAGCHFVHDLVV
jgi:VCBS repeat-containing protein